MTATVKHATDTAQLPGPDAPGFAVEPVPLLADGSAAIDPAHRSSRAGRPLHGLAGTKFGREQLAQAHAAVQAAARRDGPERDAGRSEGPPRRGGRPGAAGAGAVLGSTQSDAWAPPKALQNESWRQDTYLARAVLREVTQLERNRRCGLETIEKADGAGLRITEEVDADGTVRRTVGMSNIETCGSSCCTVCAAKVAARRLEEVKIAVEWIVKRGGSVLMCTYTMHHTTKNTLAEMVEARAVAMRNITGNTPWHGGKRQEGIKNLFGVEGFIWTGENTHGDEYGWHVHVHALFLLKHKVSQQTAEDFGYRTWKLWDAGLRRASTNPKSPLYSIASYGGVDVQIGNAAVEKIAGYLCKEIVYGHTKVGKRGNRTYMQIVNDFVRNGDVEDVELIWEVEHAMYRRKMLNWSHELRKKVRLEADKDDEDVAREDLGEKDWIVIPPREYEVKVAPVVWQLLDAAEFSGAEAAIEWLNAHGVEHEVFYDVIAEATIELPTFNRWKTPTGALARGESRMVLPSPFAGT